MKQGGLQAGATRQGLAAGPTANRGGLRGGQTRASGLGGSTRRFTRGATTTQSQDTMKDLIKTNALGQQVDITPIPLYPSRAKAMEEARRAAAPKSNVDRSSMATGARGDAESASETEGEKQKATESKQSQDAQQKLLKPEEKKQDATNMSMQSGGLTSSLAETSEDEEAKRKAEKESKSKKGPTEAELYAMLAEEIDIELYETETTFFLHIPSKKWPNDHIEEYNAIVDANKVYDNLLASKIGSDNYNYRGTQTANLTMKTREIAQRGFTQENKDLYASFWDIYDSSKQTLVSEDYILESEYNEYIEKEMKERIKAPGCLIDAEAFASGKAFEFVAASNATGAGRSGVNKSGTNSQASGKAKGSRNQKSSGSNVKESGVSQSKTSEVSGTSLSQTGTGTKVTSSEMGDFRVPKKVEYDKDAVLPDSIMLAIKIIERLLTQSKYHEQHVAYRNYPNVQLEKGKVDDDEEEEGKKKGGLGALRRGKEKKEEVEEKKEEEEINEGQITLKPLFTFECDVTAGRYVSCIDINEVNTDLVVASYGEFDINVTNDKQLKPGLLCFWTLKNPNFPERIIQTENSITCCQFSKKQPHLVAAGDSHGNIMIFNLMDPDVNKPMVESRELEGRHTEIIWELQWVQRENKGEFLISISGDGRVIEWSMKKGLELTELKQLKRQANPNQKDVYAGAEVEKKNSGMTFIETGGLTIDFPKDAVGGNYFIATEDATIHKCRTSYSAQYLQNYYGHQGVVYKVRCNPYWHHLECPIFLTCSYDWTVKVWHEEEYSPKLTCHYLSGEHILQAYVNDICWSPLTSSVFGSVANDGRIEIWDLKRDVLQPQLTHFDDLSEGGRDNTPKTIIQFSAQSPVIFTGDLQGRVGVYRTHGLEHEQVTDQDQRKRIMDAIKKDDFAAADVKEKAAEEGEYE